MTFLRALYTPMSSRGQLGAFIVLSDFYFGKCLLRRQSGLPAEITVTIKYEGKCALKEMKNMH